MSFKFPAFSATHLSKVSGIHVQEKRFSKAFFAVDFPFSTGHILGIDVKLSIRGALQREMKARECEASTKRAVK